MRHFQKLNKVIFLRNTLNKLYKIIIESINIYREYQYPLLNLQHYYLNNHIRLLLKIEGALYFNKTQNTISDLWKNCLLKIYEKIKRVTV